MAYRRQERGSDQWERWGSSPLMPLVGNYLYDGWNVIKERELAWDEVAGELQPVGTRYRTWGLDATGSLQGACSAGSEQAGGVGGLLATTTVDESTEPQTSVAHYFCYDGNGNGTQLLNSDGSLAD